MKCWQVGSLPEGAAAVGCRMLFDIKQLSGRYESRLAAQGFTQVDGEDYQETYARVAAMQTMARSGRRVPISAGLNVS